MTDQIVTGMRTAGKKQVPGGTEVWVHNPGIPGQVDVQIKLPGADTFTDLGAVRILNNEIVLPVYTVFLCHAHEDREVIDNVSKRLLQDGFVTWFARKDLLPGDDWEQKTREAIETSDYCLVFLSVNSCSKTGFAQKEIRLAFEQRERMPDGERYIIPILIDGCTPPARFEKIHWLSMAEPDWYEKLKRALRPR